MSVIDKFSHTIHEFERSARNKEVYRCVHPRCHYYRRREDLVGKEAICFVCKNVFHLTWKDLKYKRPRCEFCHNSEKAKELCAARDIALSLADELTEGFHPEVLETNEYQSD